MKVVLITGISGSGKSIAINVLEDDGFFCIDNLPSQFLQEVIAALQIQGHSRVAVSVDARSGESLAELREIIGHLRTQHDVKVLFLDARTETLVQRYSETRRRHPLAATLDAGGTTPTLLEAIDRERELMSALENLGVSIDTSDLHPNVLRQWVRDMAQLDPAAVVLLFESFAFKSGVPLGADLVFDVRCLPNPYYTPALRPLSGLDEPVARFLREVPAVNRMIGDIAQFIETWLPSYVRENRSYLTIAIGCTGGQHRSVYVVEQLAQRFSAGERVLSRHRSLASRGVGRSGTPA